MSQKGQKPTSLMASLTKNLKPKNETFFSLQTRSLAESFEGLNSSLAQSAKELCVDEATENCCFRQISKYKYIVPWQPMY